MLVITEKAGHHTPIMWVCKEKQGLAVRRKCLRLHLHRICVQVAGDATTSWFNLLSPVYMLHKTFIFLFRQLVKMIDYTKRQSGVFIFYCKHLNGQVNSFSPVLLSLLDNISHASS